MSGVVRQVASRVREALGDTRIVVIQGVRQVGKTTLIQQLVSERGWEMAPFDEPLVAHSAREDPVGSLSANPDRLLAIDEVQRVPEVILALKYLVDRDNRPGRFLPTGSANLLRLPVIEDTLTGRTEIIELHSSSQGELSGHRERFVTALLAGERFLHHTSPLHPHDYLERVVTGGYPAAHGASSLPVARQLHQQHHST